MNKNLILLPILLQVFTTLLAYSLLRIRKNQASASGQVDEARKALHDDAWPDRVLQINNNIRNQFELPVLFYVLALMLWALNAVSAWALGLAWVFSLSRIVHLAIHAGPNRVPPRRAVFTLGLVVVVLLFAITARSVLTSVLP